MTDTEHDHWKAIVVGSGMGGMTSAAALAKMGHKVLLLEQYTTLAVPTRCDNVSFSSRIPSRITMRRKLSLSKTTRSVSKAVTGWRTQPITLSETALSTVSPRALLDSIQPG